MLIWAVIAYLMGAIATTAWAMSENKKDDAAFRIGMGWPFYWLITLTVSLGDWLKKVRGKDKDL